METNMKIYDSTEKLIDGHIPNIDKDEDSSFYLSGIYALYGTNSPNVSSDAMKNNPNTLPSFFDVFKKQCSIDKSIYMSILENRFEYYVDSPTEEISTTKNPDSWSSYIRGDQYCNGRIVEQFTETSEVNDTTSIMYNGTHDSYNDDATTYDQIPDPTATDHSLVVTNYFVCNQGCLDHHSNINGRFLNSSNVLTTDVPNEIRFLKNAMDTPSEVDQKDISVIPGNNYEAYSSDVIISVRNNNENNDKTVRAGRDNKIREDGTFKESGCLSIETVIDNSNDFKKLIHDESVSYRNNKNAIDIPHVKINIISNENTKPLRDDTVLVGNLEIEVCAEISTDSLVEINECKTPVDVTKVHSDQKETTTSHDGQFKPLRPKRKTTLKLRKNKANVLTRQNNKSTVESIKKNPIPTKQGNQKKNPKIDINININQIMKENTSPAMREKKVLNNQDQRKKKRWKRQPNESCTCPICHKIYSCIREKRRHVKRHSDKKNYKCMICETSFYSKPELRRHFVKHSKERPYKCESCDKTYCHYPSKVKHIKTKHRV